jgi:hypothetical protein
VVEVSGGLGETGTVLFSWSKYMGAVGRVWMKFVCDVMNVRAQGRVSPSARAAERATACC